MIYCSEKIRVGALRRSRAFSLIEAVSALVILALISSGVLMVIDRCIISATDSTLRIRAFEVARENMETLLASNSVKEQVEYGSSEKYPQIQWQTVVEAFYEPLTARMWARGVCSRGAKVVLKNNSLVGEREMVVAQADIAENGEGDKAVEEDIEEACHVTSNLLRSKFRQFNN